MTRTRWLIVLFWVFVASMLLEQCYSSRMRYLAEEKAHPKPEHFFFTPQPQGPVPVAPSADADVQQTKFEVRLNTPPGNFTCLVTLTNMGSSKAENVQIMVRPFRGSTVGSPDIGHTNYHYLKENEPLSQLGTFVSFPDLAAGQSATESVVFIKQGNGNPGGNPKPQILFTTVKSSR